MIRLDGTWRATTLVVLALLIALALTAAASSAYRRERAVLGERHYRTGLSLAASGLNDQATEEFRKALLFQPDNLDYRLSLATALIHANRLNEAQSHLEELADAEPSNPVISIDLAEIALKRKQLATAIREFQRGVYEYWPADQIPERRAARWQLVELLADSGRKTEAIGELMQLYASSPPGISDRARIGDLLLQYGALSEANRVFSDLVRAHPNSARAQRGLAEVEFDEGDYVQARHSYQHALHEDPKDVASQQGLALTNAVIDLDPAIPGIGSSERRRRSANLLERIVQDINTCAGVGTGSGQDVQRWQSAQVDTDRLLAGPHPPDEDVTYEMQQTAVQLWNQRRSFCGGNVPTDPAVNTVVGRTLSE